MHPGLLVRAVARAAALLHLPLALQQARVVTRPQAPKAVRATLPVTLLHLGCPRCRRAVPR
jgi:hypothetical protein